MLLTHPTDEQQLHLRKIFNEDPETRKRDLEIIKQWLLKQPHLPDTWDEHCLLTFLRGCKFSLEKCKKKLDVYFTVRAAFPEFFTNRDIRRPELQAICDLADFAVLPDLTTDGARISVAKASKLDFETPNLAEVFKVLFMIGDIRLKLEEGVMDTYIFDLNFPLAKHFLNAIRINPMAIKKFFVCIQDAYPVIIKEVHLINAPPFVSFAINFVKPFLNETLRNSIYVHTNIETLYDFVSKEILPEEYGKKNVKLTDLKKEWMKTLEEYTSWFKEEEKIKADVSKKTREADLNLDLTGTEGSFRELSID